MSITINDETLAAVGMTETELLREIAILLFQLERFTLGQASRFAQMDQLKFQRALAERKISLHYDIAELQADVQLLASNQWQ